MTHDQEPKNPYQHPVHDTLDEHQQRREFDLLLEPDKPERREPKLTAWPPPPQRRRTDLEVCLAFFAAPPRREEAIDKLVVTFGPLSGYAPEERAARTEERRASIRERWRSCTLDGLSVALAMPSDIEIETVGLAGWALDRQHRGECNQGGWSWIRIACVAHTSLVAA